MLQYLGSGYIGSLWPGGGEPRDGELDDLETILNSPAPALGAPAGVGHPSSQTAELELNTLADRLRKQESDAEQHAAAAIPGAGAALLRRPIWSHGNASSGQLVEADRADSQVQPADSLPCAAPHNGLTQWIPPVGHFQRATVAVSLVGAGVGGVVAGPLGMAAGAKSGALMMAAGAGVCGAAHQYYLTHRGPGSMDAPVSRSISEVFFKWTMHSRA
ncbi:hypothetical protein WJX72_005129 [[Myrmecia] bisecta]|uniref:Uncharacterized protein n=1 Tax=[Myrmecia] bisecta TaxID=41462 RepID=A0AAW1QQN4_9CHLO